MRRIIYLLIVSVVSTMAVAQSSGSLQDASKFRKLSISQMIPLAAQPASLQLPVRCDGEGNSYIRFFHGTAGLREPIYKFDKAGVQAAVFSFVSDPEFEPRSAAGLDFAIDPDGKVYQLVKALSGTFVARFNKAGALESKIKLEMDFNALRIGMFDSGDMLISGVERETAANLTPHMPLTGLFDPKGKLLRRIVLPEDKAYEEAAARGDSDFFDASLGGGGNFAAERGREVRASDGNIYLMRWTNPTKVYAISAKGDLVRSFDVDPDMPHKKPTAMHERSGKLAILYGADQDDVRSMIKVVDLSGMELGVYDSQNLGVAFSCYSGSDAFSFLRVEGKQLMLKVAQ